MSSRHRHVPLRMCAGCRRRFPKESLVRFALKASAGRGAAGDQQVVLDLNGRSGGRGAYVCPRLECFEAATGRGKPLQRRMGAASQMATLREEFESLIERLR